MRARARWGFATLVLALLATATLAPSSAFAAEETHPFNATLSLTGGCAESTLDPVPDPGLCPMPPGVPGVDHPLKAFTNAKGTAVDSYGDRYVASYGPEAANPNKGRIDIFGPTGKFIGEFVDSNGPKAVAVDSKGNLYVQEFISGGVHRDVRYAPTAYAPEAGEISYGSSPTILLEFGASSSQMWVDPINDHVFIPVESAIQEYSSAAEGNKLLDETIGQGHVFGSHSVAIDATRKRIYANTALLPETVENAPINKVVVRVFELESPHALLKTIDGSTTPAGRFLSETTTGSPIAVNEATGHLFVGEYRAETKVQELTAEGAYLSTIEHGFNNTGFAQIAVDNGIHSPNQGYLYVPSGEGATHSYAFEGKPPAKPPIVEAVSVGGITEDEAVLHGTVNPEGSPTEYRIEYTTQQHYEEEGESFTGAAVVGEGELGVSSEGVTVSAPLMGLSPATAYRFRVVAENEKGEDEGQESFVTYRAPDASVGCTNEALRIGTSAGLPDCRAYELVTPPDTNGHSPIAMSAGPVPRFFSRQVSPSGEKVSFLVMGGTLPGIEGGGGYLYGDSYLASRGAQGWSTSSAGPDGVDAESALDGTFSPDQGYSFWVGEGTFLRYPDGHSELVGRGSIGTSSFVEGQLISENGSHVIFTLGQVRLEPDSPPEGTGAIYDRTIDPVTGEEETHLVSLLPGDVTPGAGQGAAYEGASLDGRGVAFRVGSTSPLYLRVDDEKTFLVAPAGSTFEGVGEGGGRLFYLKGGDLYAFDATSESTIRFSEAGNVTPVNISADGTTAYFLSPGKLTEEANPEGAVPKEGERNLYASREGQITFVGPLVKRDVEGPLGNDALGGLKFWSGSNSRSKPAMDPSRTTADGSVLLFESRAKLTSYDPEGHDEVYRYDVATVPPTLDCLSCNPTGVPASGDASLQTLEISSEAFDLREPLTGESHVTNMNADGGRVFFESKEPLVLNDTDGAQDVYEWEEEGVGSCRSEGGCVYLISSGQSGKRVEGEPNYLYGVSDGGRDVFVWTSDRLLPSADPDETPSIYDARVEGGFPPPSAGAGECLGEACQPAAEAPDDPTPASSTFEGQGNVREETPATRTPCAKGKVRRHGKCVAKKHRRRRARRHGRAGR
jgi:hypothetical protein